MKHVRIHGSSDDSQTTHLVTCRHRRATGQGFDGKSFDDVGSEWGDGYTEAQCVKDIIEGQHEGVTRIVAVNLVDGTARNVTEDISRFISQSQADWYSEDAVRLVKQFGFDDPRDAMDREAAVARREMRERESDYRRAAE